MNTIPSNTSTQSVLIVDDEAAMRTALEVSFRRQGWNVESAAGKTEALARLQLRRQGLVITDIRMPDGDGFAVMRAARELSRRTAVILLTAFASVPDAVAAMKSGACEYLVKPVPFEQLLEAAERIVAGGQMLPCEGTIVGSSPALRRALDQARQAAQSDADVLIEAESGTGKELLARMVHSLSVRHASPFVAINCAGIPESLLESELFGHGRGAFTGADCVQAGKFELANGGTLLLDEIGEMPLNLQPKLLRVLQEREYFRLGETHPVKLDLRVIATTNRSLLAMVRQGAFRNDLYYRLNVVPLSLPPLRERREDIRELARHFARQFSPQVAVELPEAFVAQLERYSWPGNVRELANLIRRTLALGVFPGAGELAPCAEVAAVEHTLQPAQPCLLPPGISADTLPQKPGALYPGLSLEAMERRLLEMTLDATCGNRSRAAEMLGVSLRTVRNKIREYRLPPRSEYAILHD